MKRKKISSVLSILLLVFTLLCSKQISAQNQDDCFDFSGAAFLSGLWYADGETTFNATRTIDGEAYHRARLWASGEYRLQLIEAFEAGIPGIRFFIDENAEQNEPKNMFFWVLSNGPFKDYDPENIDTLVAAPPQFVESRSGILSWLMGVIYGEGWRTGTIMDEAKTVGIERIEKAEELLIRAGFETVSIEEKSRKYRLFIKSADFPKVLSLPFRRWTRVPGNGGSTEPPTDVEPYPSCIVNEIDAKFDASLDNKPGRTVRISVLDNDILSDGSTATFDKIRFDLNPDTAKLETWFGTDTYSWRINNLGQLAFKPKTGFDGESKNIRYKVIEIATGLSDIVYAKVTYDIAEELNTLNSNTFLHVNPVNQGDILEFSLPKDSETTICEIYDMTGRLVEQFTVEGNEGAFEISKLNQGNYFIKIYLPEQSETLQFVIN